MLVVVGARGDAGKALKRLEKVRREGLEAQLLNAQMVCGKDHVITAVEHALRAFSRKENVAETISMELLLYASGQRQINKAIERMGVHPSDHEIGVVVLGAGKVDIAQLLRSLGLERDDDVLEFREEKLKRWGITDEEMAAVDHREDLILEKVALLAVQK
jgi:KEOPS complex subunit Cgi121